MCDLATLRRGKKNALNARTVIDALVHSRGDCSFPQRQIGAPLKITLVNMPWAADLTLKNARSLRRRKRMLLSKAWPQRSLKRTQQMMRERTLT